MKIEDKEIIKKLTKISKNGENKQERRRSHALLLSNDGYKSKELSIIFDVSQRTIFQWFRAFKEKGVESLKGQDGRGRKNKLSKEKDLEIVKKHIEMYPNQPKKAYALTLEEIDIKVCYNTYKSFLKKYLI